MIQKLDQVKYFIILLIGVNTSVINSEEIFGIAKIKSKLSLKVQIPDSKAPESKNLESDTRVRKIFI